MSALRLIAGSAAKKRIAADGLTPDQVKTVIGASGGPKWLVLRGLDQFIFGHWLADACHKIDLVGSSIGAWRMTLAAHPDPARKFNEFIQWYFTYRADDGVSAADITRQSYEILHKVFPREDLDAIVANDRRNLNIVAVRCKGLAASDNQFLEATGLISAAATNLVSRDRLADYFDRAVFHSHADPMLPTQWQGFGRIDTRLTADIIPDVLMASGSVPFVVEPVKDIAGAPPGVYRDGGVIDYHFDIPWRNGSGIILYPHFYPHITPGWFDKSLQGRRAAGEVFDERLILCPSESFVESLPYGKIPERKNFTKMTDSERLTYWQTVIDQSESLADEFAELLEHPDKLMDRLEDAPQ